MSQDTAYVLGSDDAEIARLDGQFADVSTTGVQLYIAPDDPRGPIQCEAILRTLAPQLAAHGIATEAELGLETLPSRIAEQLVARDAMLLPSTVVGAWGTRPAVSP